MKQIIWDMIEESCVGCREQSPFWHKDHECFDAFLDVADHITYHFDNAMERLDGQTMQSLRASLDKDTSGRFREEMERAIGNLIRCDEWTTTNYHEGNDDDDVDDCGDDGTTPAVQTDERGRVETQSGPGPSPRRI